MPTLPTTIADLSTTAALNYPAGTDSPSTLDDVQRAHASYIALVRDLVGYGTGTYVPATAATNMGFARIASPTFTGTVALPIVTISGAVTGASTAKFDDVTTWRAGAVTTGYYYCGNTNTKYMGFDGSTFVFSAPVVIPGGSTATTQATNNSSTLIATTAFVQGLAYGAGMAYTSTGNTIGTTYTNSTAKVRKVSAFATSAVGGNNWWGGNVNSVTIAISNSSVATGSTIAIQFDVPPGATYSITHGAGSTPAASWYEA